MVILPARSIADSDRVHVPKSQRRPLDDTITKRRLVVDDQSVAHTPPSALCQRPGTLNPSKFAFNNPPTPNPIPLELLHPIFAEFIVNAKKHVPTPADNAVVRELCMEMTLDSDSEAEKCSKFRRILSKHYKLTLYAAEVGPTQYKTDGHLQVGPYMAVVCEGKLWNGEGNPQVQGALYWLQSVRENMKEKDPLDLLPCIIIHFIGACLLQTLYPCLLFIGSQIGFAGSILTDRAQLQTLTNIFPLNASFYDEETAIQTARAFGAFKIAVDKLSQYYQALDRAQPNPPTPERSLRLTFPYPDGWTVGGEKFTLTYRFRHYEDKLIFHATTTQGDARLVKFTRRYSKEAHDACAEAGVAPKLYGFLPLPAGWYMVVMDYFAPETYSVLQASDSSNASLVAGIHAIVRVMHDLGYVHGDIRHVNIMKCLQKTGEWGVGSLFLIDFDWAGLVGKVRYPRNLNKKTVIRPADAEDGALIEQTHDLFMIEHMFDAIGQSSSS